MSEDGKVAVTRVLDEASFKVALKDKLLEECDEVQTAVSAEDLKKELGDVLEVVYTLADQAGITPEQLEQSRRQRASERGGFALRIWLEETYPKP